MKDANTDAAAGDGVHRLIDMVVEEVSLVDRAANKHRFLIVKRDDAMDDNTLTEVTTATVEETPAEGEDETGEIDDDSPLGAAVAALESLTDVVELLSALGGDATDPRLATLADQLGTAADQLLARIGVSTEEDEPQAVEARASDATAGAPATKLQTNLAAAKAAVQRLAARRAKTPAPKTAAPKTDKAADPATEVAATAKSLASLSESFRSLSETVKQQQQRLGRIEKQFGLPNSAAPAEQVSKAAPEEVGWPLDLNKPMDRENVDKTISFHDL
jgi:division protein CdvB (Snf7/Vps24/ESCRT-III family)